LVNQEKKTTGLKMEIEIAGVAGFLFAATSVGVLICERQERPSPAGGYDAD
jgi:hypothetical protein